MIKQQHTAVLRFILKVFGCYKPFAFLFLFRSQTTNFSFLLACKNLTDCVWCGYRHAEVAQATDFCGHVTAEFLNHLSIINLCWRHWLIELPHLFPFAFLI